MILKFKKGSGIHIKPENKGKFTEYKKRTGKTTEEALHSKDPHVRKMALFAKNAAKWKHFLGGKFKGTATDNGFAIKDHPEKSKPKVQLVKKKKK